MCCGWKHGYDSWRKTTNFVMTKHTDGQTEESSPERAGTRKSLVLGS